MVRASSVSVAHLPHSITGCCNNIYKKHFTLYLLPIEYKLLIVNNNCVYDIHKLLLLCTFHDTSYTFVVLAFEDKVQCNSSWLKDCIIFISIHVFVFCLSFWNSFFLFSWFVPDLLLFLFPVYKIFPLFLAWEMDLWPRDFQTYFCSHGFCIPSLLSALYLNWKVILKQIFLEKFMN